MVVHLIAYPTKTEDIEPAPLRFTTMVLKACGPLRLLRLFRYYNGSQIFVRALYQSLWALLVPLFVIFICITCFGELALTAT